MMESSFRLNVLAGLDYGSAEHGDTADDVSVIHNSVFINPDTKQVSSSWK